MPGNVDPVLTARAHLANASRKGARDPQQVAEARRNLNAAKLERFIRASLAEAPPLTEQQRAHLSTHIASGGGIRMTAKQNAPGVTEGASLINIESAGLNQQTPSILALAGRRFNVVYADGDAKTKYGWRSLGRKSWPEVLAWLDLERPASVRGTGGYVFGALTGEERNREAVQHRGILALDADTAEPGFIAGVRETLPGVAFAYHTTYRSTPEKPRYRVLIPLDADVTGPEYTRISKQVIAAVGSRQFDRGSVDPERFMYRPSTTDPAAYEYGSVDGAPLDSMAWQVDRYTRKARAEELGRLARCNELGWATERETGAGWDTTTFEVACQLIEFANSEWSAYTLEQAEADLMEHAPSDAQFGPRQHAEKWASALRKVDGQGRPDPGGDFSGADAHGPDGGRVLPSKTPLAVRLRCYVEDHYDVFPAEADGRVFGQPKTVGRAEEVTARFVMRAVKKVGLGSTSGSLSAAATEAAKVLSAEAADAPPRTLAMRCHYRAGRVVLDLAQLGNTRCVVVTAEGWTVRDVPPADVTFITNGAPLPDPVPGGDLDALRRLLGWDEADDRWQLVRGWLPAALLSDLPRPLLGFFGPQGSAKTTTGRYVVGVLDPKPAGTLGSSFGKNKQDDETKALKSFLVAWDNLTAVSGEGSDFLARLVTGDLIERRMLYTDSDLVSIRYRRTGVVTGITLPRGIKADALDRLIPIQLEPLGGARRSEAKLDAEWEAVHPQALGGVLDLAVRMLGGTGANPNGLRMADYAEALHAVDPLAYAAYARNVAGAKADMAADDTMVQLITAWLELCGDEWEGTADQALNCIHAEAGARQFDSHGKWLPQSARALSDHLTRDQELLAAAGITVETRRSNGRRIKRFTLHRPEADAARLPGPSDDRGLL